MKNSEISSAREASPEINKNTEQSATKQVSTRMKKGKKPIWAKTDQEIEDQEEKEAD